MVADPVPAPTSTTRSLRLSGNRATSARTASRSILLAARATGAFRYRSAGVGSPLLNRSVSGSVRPSSTSASALPHRRNSPISVTPWECCSAIDVANASRSSGMPWGSGSSRPTSTTKPSPLAASTPDLASISSIRRKRRRCSGMTLSRCRKSSGSTVSLALRCHPSSSRVASARERDHRSKSARRAFLSSGSTRSAARYSDNKPEPAATVVGLGKKSAGVIPDGRARSRQTTSYSKSFTPSTAESSAARVARFTVYPLNPPRGIPFGL